MKRFVFSPLIGYVVIFGILAVFSLITAVMHQRLPHLNQLAQHAGERILIGRVVEVNSTEVIKYELIPYVSQQVKVEANGKVYEGVGFQTMAVGQAMVKPGDKVLMGQLTDEAGSYTYIIDIWRLDTLGIVVAIFLLLLLVILGKASMRSLLGLSVSFYVVISFLVPFIAYGYSPLLVTFISILVIIPTTFFIVHGFDIKTTISTLATTVTLMLTGLLAYWVVEAAKLTGIIHDDMITLLAASDVTYNFPGLVLAGMLISAFGILDDVTIAQASLVKELYHSDGQKTVLTLFASAMRVGRDHIASVINTLLLVYAGAMLPTFLLFSRFPRPFMVLLNSEVVTLELMAGLISSTAMMAAIPATTLLAAFYYCRLR